MKFESKKNVNEQVVEEAWNNPAFKAALIENPVEAIQSLTGQRIKLPEGMERLVVVDQSDPKAFYFNIPVKLDMEDVELTEEQLEAVAGGISFPYINIPTLPPCFPYPPTNTGDFDLNQNVSS